VLRQEVLFNIKASPILRECVDAGGFIPHDIPRLAGTVVAGQGQRDRSEILCGNRYVVQEQRPPRRERESLNFTRGLAWAQNTERGFDTDAEVPPQAPQLRQ
jgi:hypothetical protein